MPYTPPFLARLGLDNSADERAIRRAYARLLKQIDQETEPARFQSLREDYEQALAWLSWRDTDDHDGYDGVHRAFTDEYHTAPLAATADGTSRPPFPAHESAPAASTPWPASGIDAQPDPDALADELYQQLLAALPRLRTGSAPDDAGLLADELRRCLDDERMFNLAASTAFEARVAHLLAGAYQPGHGTLFNAAVDVFGWMSDPRRLEKFHHAGAVLNRAIDERTMFNAQLPAELRAQRQALRALALPEVPAAAHLARLLPHVETMMARFPVLMNMSADRASVDRWRARFAGADGHVPPASERARAFLKKLMHGQFPAYLLFAIIVAVFVMYSTTPQPPIPVVQLAPAGVTAITVTATPLKPPVARTNLPPDAERTDTVLFTQQQIDAITLHFDYKVEADTPFGMRAAEFAVHLDRAGNLALLDLSRSSNDARFDDAVEKAVRGAQPFAASTARGFKLVFSARIIHKDSPREWVRPPQPQ